MSENYVNIKIPKKLYEKIKKKVGENKDEFKDIDDYIKFVLTEVIKEENESETIYTTEETEQIKKRLRELGYI